MNNSEKKLFRFGIVQRLLVLMITPLVILAIVIAAIAVNAMIDGMQQEALDALKGLTTSIRAAYDAIDEGDYFLNENGELMKGTHNITQRTDIIDSFTEGNAMETTICYGDTRMATSLLDAQTGERMVGTQVSAEVGESVLKNGTAYASTKVEINGENYYSYYDTLYNSDGSIVGIVFAGEPSAEVDALINERTLSIIFAAVIMFMIAVGVESIFILSITKKLVAAEKAVVMLAEGEVNTKVPETVEKRADEIGDMARAVNLLSGKLQEVLGNIKVSADKVLETGHELEMATAQTSANADEISHAVAGISSGAVSQAESVENAMMRVTNIGKLIGDIADGMERMDGTTSEVSAEGQGAVAIIEELNESNDHTMEAIERIGEQVRATDHSVDSIQEAVTLISSIAEETNLLSLNASIEAARAGEAGRGFAVVASQIQKLAEESNASASKIAEVINKLSLDSRASIAVMEELQEMVLEQKKKLDETRERFMQVNQGIGECKNETSAVNIKTEECNRDCNEIVETFESLSAISEQNAASAEETTASMQELNATITKLADDAGTLKDLAGDLTEAMKYFEL